MDFLMKTFDCNIDNLPRDELQAILMCLKHNALTLSVLNKNRTFSLTELQTVQHNFYWSAKAFYYYNAANQLFLKKKLLHKYNSGVSEMPVELKQHSKRARCHYVNSTVFTRVMIAPLNFVVKIRFFFSPA